MSTAKMGEDYDLDIPGQQPLLNLPNIPSYASAFRWWMGPRIQPSYNGDALLAHNTNGQSAAAEDICHLQSLKGIQE